MERPAPRGSRRGASGVLRRRQQEPRPDQGHGDDGHVDEEDRAPREVLQQEAAEHGPEGTARTGGGGPHTDGPAPLLGVVEDVGEQRQGGRHDQRGTHAHRGPGEDQLGGAGRQAGQDRAHAEDDEAHHEGALAAEAVADAAHGEEEPGEHERVAVDDPLELARGGLEIAQQVGDGDVEDRVVERDHEEAHAQHGQRPPASFVDLRLVHLAAHCRHRRPGWHRLPTLNESWSFRNTIVS